MCDVEGGAAGTLDLGFRDAGHTDIQVRGGESELTFLGVDADVCENRQGGARTDDVLHGLQSSEKGVFGDAESHILNRLDERNSGVGNCRLFFAVWKSVVKGGKKGLDAGETGCGLVLTLKLIVQKAHHVPRSLVLGHFVDHLPVCVQNGAVIAASEGLADFRK